MTVIFDDAVRYVLLNEGGYVFSENDPGGATNFGISIRFLKSLSLDKLRSYGLLVGDIITDDDIKHLTVDQAKAIYKSEFWDQAPFEQLPNQKIANYIFDMAVNHGIAVAIKMTQRSLWAVTSIMSPPDDGIMGNKTLEVVGRAAYIILPILKATRAEYYRSLVSASPGLRSMLDGLLERAYRG